jgi:hypothetical protein
MATRKPNVLVTGTPGTGKTTTAQQAASGAGLRYINVGDWVKEKELHDGWDDEFDCYTVDEDKVRTNICLLMRQIPRAHSVVLGCRTALTEVLPRTGGGRYGGGDERGRQHRRLSQLRLLPRTVSGPCVRRSRRAPPERDKQTARDAPRVVGLAPKAMVRMRDTLHPFDAPAHICLS